MFVIDTSEDGTRNFTGIRIKEKNVYGRLLILGDTIFEGQLQQGYKRSVRNGSIIEKNSINYRKNVLFVHHYSVMQMRRVLGFQQWYGTHI